VRRHPGQLTKESISTGALIDENIALFDEYGDKPYVKKTFFGMTMRKLRMAYRVWMCRDSMSAERRNQVLADHSSKLFYVLLMPPIAGGLAAWRKLAAVVSAKRRDE
jgi:hypothetical protein